MSSTLLISDPDVRGRLWVVDVLRDRFSVDIPGPGESLLRAVRRLRPAAVLLAVPRGRGGEAVRACRLIKTDTTAPPLVGLLDHWGRLGRAERRTLGASLADGYLGGRVSPEELCRFVQALISGHRPVVSNVPPPGIAGRIVGRLRR